MPTSTRRGTVRAGDDGGGAAACRPEGCPGRGRRANVRGRRRLATPEKAPREAPEGDEAEAVAPARSDSGHPRGARAAKGKSHARGVRARARGDVRSPGTDGGAVGPRREERTAETPPEESRLDRAERSRGPRGRPHLRRRDRARRAGPRLPEPPEGGARPRPRRPRRREVGDP